VTTRSVAKAEPLLKKEQEKTHKGKKKTQKALSERLLSRARQWAMMRMFVR